MIKISFSSPRLEDAWAAAASTRDSGTEFDRMVASLIRQADDALLYGWYDEQRPAVLRNRELERRAEAQLVDRLIGNLAIPPDVFRGSYSAEPAR